MPTIQSFRDLLVWQKSMDLAVRTYRLARQLPRSEDSVLGHSTPAYIRHLWIAHGSGGELESQLEVGHRLGLIPAEAANLLIRDAQEIGRMINGLAKSLSRGESSQPRR